MSGKLIMKRKRADQQRSQQAEEEQQQEQPQAEAEQKRHRLDSRPITPPAEEEPNVAGPAEEAPNSILIEALQKIMELQSELAAFEQDLNEREEEEARLDAEVADNFMPPTSAPAPAQRSQAEALGFAMCARETLLFLQSEGISTESVLYKTLLGKLAGQSDGLLQA